MSSVKMIFLILVFLLGGLWETEAMSVTGVLGKEVTIKCSHSNAFNNVKYFCKGTCENEDVLISSRKKIEKDSNEKYNIKDEGNTFTVTISGLTEEDAGTYWCGIDRIGWDTYSQVVITVVKGNTKDPDNDLPQSNLNTSPSKKLVYIGAGLGVVVLSLAVVLFMFFRHRNRDIHRSSGKDHDTVYAMTSSHDGHHVTSSLTTNGDKETDCRTTGIFTLKTAQHQDTRRDPSDNIYSNVTVSSSLTSHIQPDGLFYSTVSFSKHTDCSTVTPPIAALTYSTIKHKAMDESSIHYNV